MISKLTGSIAEHPSRRRLIKLLTTAAMLSASDFPAFAQTYPTRIMRLIVPYGPGGDIDVVARLVGRSLSDRYGQAVVIENKPGAGSNIGVQAAINSPPDGYTLLMIGITNAVNASLYKELPFNFLRDVTPIAGPIGLPLLLVANPSFAPTDIEQLIAFAKANPGKVNIGSFGTGTISHLAIELLKMMTGIDVVHVPYSGAAALNVDLISGQLHAGFSSASSTLPHVRSGTLRALGVTSGVSRIAGIPALADKLPGYEVNSWMGLGVPRQTPTEIVDKLNRDINAALGEPSIKAILNEAGASSTPLGVADLQAFVAAETEKWGQVVRQAGLKAN
ncbi:MAG: transporter [Hyphomicrobiales bacterium]|nr:transporter [Hyphomicrobiales bacterium]